MAANMIRPVSSCCIFSRYTASSASFRSCGFAALSLSTFAAFSAHARISILQGTILIFVSFIARFRWSYDTDNRHECHEHRAFVPLVVWPVLLDEHPARRLLPVAELF